MSDVDLTRVLNRNRRGLPKKMVVTDQLNELIGYSSEWDNNIKMLN